MNSQPELKILISRHEIEEALQRLADEIKKDYQDKQPLLLSVLKGSFVFLADLIRKLDFPLEVEFIRLSSYGRGRNTPGELKMVQGLKESIKNRDVLVIEDIIDTGRSIAFLKDYLLKKKPASVKLCALTDKPSRREVPIDIDYLGFSIPDKFIVGYGIDWDERYRYLPDICYVEETD